MFYKAFLRWTLKISGAFYEQNLKHFIGQRRSTVKSFTKEAVRKLFVSGATTLSLKLTKEEDTSTCWSVKSFFDRNVRAKSPKSSLVVVL